MPIQLDILKDRKNADAYRKFSYADLKLDLDLNSHIPSTPVGQIFAWAVVLRLPTDPVAAPNVTAIILFGIGMILFSKPKKNDKNSTDKFILSVTENGELELTEVDIGGSLEEVPPILH